MGKCCITKFITFCLCIGFLYVPFISSEESEKMPKDIYLTGGNLLDVSKGKIIPNSLVILRGDTILYAGAQKEFNKAPDSTVIDCTGNTLLPGLFDAHIHLGGSSTLEQAKDAVKARKINPAQKPSATQGGTAKDKKAQTTGYETRPEITAKIIEAKETLKNGANTWDPELMKKARDQFLGLLAREKQENPILVYYVALCDYRLTSYYIASGMMNQAETYTKEGQKYLEKGMEMDPDLGELDALYASMLGFEIALHQEKAMSLGFQIFQYFGKAFEKSPQNPRVHFLKGVSDLFTPEQFGGGADAAIKTLSTCVELYAKENIQDHVKPSWGEEEAFTFLAMAYNQKGEKKKAEEFFKKALDINPAYSLAKEKLRKFKK